MQPDRHSTEETGHDLGRPLDDFLRVLDALDAEPPDREATSRRAFPRHPYRQVVSVLSFRRGLSTHRNVLGRNLGGGGFSALGVDALTVGQPCIVFLPQLAGGNADLTANVCRVRHIERGIYEIAVHWHQEIDISRFLEF